MNTEEIKKDTVIKTVSYLYNNDMLKNIYTGSWSELHNLILQSLESEEKIYCKHCKTYMPFVEKLKNNICTDCWQYHRD